MIDQTAINTAGKSAKHSSLRLLLSMVLAVVLLAVVQLEVSHVHVFDHGIECDLHASGSSLDTAVSQVVDWFSLFALALLLVVVSVSQSTPVFPRFLSRAPPVFHH